MGRIGQANVIIRIGNLVLALFAISLASVSYASSNLADALGTLCTTGQVFLGGAVMLLIVLSGVTYAVGQVLGAETRARATVWATAMLTGALIGAVIYIIMPPVLTAIMGSPATCTVNTGPCNHAACASDCAVQGMRGICPGGGGPCQCI